MSDGLVASLRAPIRGRADFGAVLAGSWSALSPAELARRPVMVEGAAAIPLGDLFAVSGTASALIRFEGDLRRVDRLGAGLSEGTVVVESGVGHEAGIGMSGGVLDVRGNAGWSPGIGSKRGSVIALGRVEIPATYRYACTYQPDHIRLTLLRLRDRHGLKVQKRHLIGFYRRYSGDLGDLGRGEILAWTAE